MKMQGRRRVRSHRLQTVRVDVGDVPKTGMVLLLGLLAIMVASALAFVWFQRETERLQQQVVELRHEVEIRTQETENLCVRLESYRSLPLIRAAVVRMGLGLRPAFPGQVCRVNMAGERSGEQSGDETLVARR
jgi:hypothetical protein